jgi:hypothetical protein
MDIRILIGMNGWVFAGVYLRSSTYVTLTHGFVVRKWGTTMGLGQLAKDGPTKDTVLEPTPDVEVHEQAVVATIKCDVKKWKKLCE